MKKIMQFPSVHKVNPELNDYQIAAIKDIDGYHCINSGAGTGKSSVLVARLQRIHELCPSATVLMLAFTKAAALELQNRVGNISGVTISTLHSLSYHIVKSSGWNFTVETDTDKQATIISDLISSRSSVSVDDVIKSLHCVTGSSKPVLRVRHNFLLYLKENHVLTFDTLPLIALDILKKYAPLRHNWQNRYDFIQCDEAQDLDAVQVDILNLLAAHSKNLCVCGDSRQQIFGFRFACNAMEQFSKISANHDLIFNYRCNPAILNLANSIMERYPALVALSNLPAIQPTFITAKDSADEAKTVADTICELLQHGYSYKDFAVLYRSSSVSGDILQELLARQIPFDSKSPLLFKYNSKLWRDIIRILTFLDEPTSVDKLQDILPLFYLKKSCIADINRMVAEQRFSLVAGLPLLTKKTFHHDYVAELSAAVDAATNMNPAQAIRHLLKHGLDKYFGDSITFAIEGVISELSKFPTFADFLNHVQAVKKQIKSVKEISAKSDNLVQLMTIHTAKGKEWKVVFLIGCTDGVLPSSLENTDVEEEKRLLYVAVTRAKERLYISYPNISDDSIEQNKPCRFLAGHF